MKKNRSFSNISVLGGRNLIEYTTITITTRYLDFILVSYLDDFREAGLLVT